MKKTHKKQHTNKNFPPKKIPQLFCHKTNDPICFHIDVVINQRKLMFKKKVAPGRSWGYKNGP